MSNDRPEPGTPEFYEWLKEQAKKDADEIFSAGPADFDETGVLSGSPENLFKSDAELFPEEFEEYTPEDIARLKKVAMSSGDPELLDRWKRLSEWLRDNEK